MGVGTWSSTCMLLGWWFSFCEPYWPRLVDSGLLVVPLTPLCHSILSPTFLSSAWCLVVGLCICLHSLLDETFQETVMLVFYLQAQKIIINSVGGWLVRVGCSLCLCSILIPAHLLDWKNLGWVGSVSPSFHWKSCLTTGGSLLSLHPSLVEISARVILIDSSSCLQLVSRCLLLISILTPSPLLPTSPNNCLPSPYSLTPCSLSPATSDDHFVSFLSETHSSFLWLSLLLSFFGSVECSMVVLHFWLMSNYK